MYFLLILKHKTLLTTKVYMDISFNYTLTLIDLVFKSIFSLYLQPSVIVTAKKSPKKYPKTAVKSDELARVANVQTLRH